MQRCVTEHLRVVTVTRAEAAMQSHTDNVMRTLETLYAPCSPTLVSLRYPESASCSGARSGQVWEAGEHGAHRHAPGPCGGADREGAPTLKSLSKPARASLRGFEREINVVSTGGGVGTQDDATHEQNTRAKLEELSAQSKSCLAGVQVLREQQEQLVRLQCSP